MPIDDLTVHAIASFLTEDPKLFREEQTIEQQPTSDYQSDSLYDSDATGSDSGSQVFDISKTGVEQDNDWSDPDQFYRMQGSVTFIYTFDGVMYYGDYIGTKHFQLIEDNPELIDRYRLGYFFDVLNDRDTVKQQDEAHTDCEPRRIAMRRGDLLGRLYANRKETIVSFWNVDREAYDALLPACLQQLVADNKATGEIMISTPVHGTIPAETLEDHQTEEITPEMAKHVEMRQQLHVMQGDEKKRAMKELGVGGQRKNPWQAEAEKHGVVRPGQKWWAVNSEGLDQELAGLNSILCEWGPSKGFNVAVRGMWFDPDRWYTNYDAVPFFYFFETGEFISGGENDTHQDLIKHHRLFELLEEDTARAGIDVHNQPDTERAGNAVRYRPLFTKRAGRPSNQRLALFTAQEPQQDSGSDYPPNSDDSDSDRSLFSSDRCEDCGEPQSECWCSGQWRRDQFAKIAFYGRIGFPSRARLVDIVTDELLPDKATQALAEAPSQPAFISFWNRDKAVYDAHLKACVSALVKGEVATVRPITLEDYVSFPIQTITVDEVLNGASTATQLTPEQQRKVELQQQLHLMRGDEKKRAMAELGVGGTAPHPMQTAMRQTGLIGPGQKWWAPHSESFGLDGTVLFEDEEPRMTDKWAAELKEVQVDPDDLYRNARQVQCFYYTTDGRLCLSDKDDQITHIDMLSTNQELKERYTRLFGKNKMAVVQMRQAAVMDLLGRVGIMKYGLGDRIQFVSVWNQGKTLELLPQCLGQLLNDGIITDDCFVWTPEHGAVPLDQILHATASAHADPDLDLRRELHMMHGAKKRAAMEKLNVGSPMRSSGQVPGQPWRYPQSEGLRRKDVL